MEKNASVSNDVGWKNVSNQELIRHIVTITSPIENVFLDHKMCLWFYHKPKLQEFDNRYISKQNLYINFNIEIFANQFDLNTHWHCKT